MWENSHVAGGRKSGITKKCAFGSQEKVEREEHGQQELGGVRTKSLNLFENSGHSSLGMNGNSMLHFSLLFQFSSFASLVSYLEDTYSHPLKNPTLFF